VSSAAERESTTAKSSVRLPSSSVCLEAFSHCLTIRQTIPRLLFAVFCDAFKSPKFPSYGYPVGFYAFQPMYHSASSGYISLRVIFRPCLRAGASLVRLVINEPFGRLVCGCLHFAVDVNWAILASILLENTLVSRHQFSSNFFSAPNPVDNELAQ
jgi:hypothetical protein